MKRLIITLWIATILALVFLSLTQRYTIIGISRELPYGYKLDKLTGKVWFLQGALRQILIPIEEEKDKK